MLHIYCNIFVTYNDNNIAEMLSFQCRLLSVKMLAVNTPPLLILHAVQ